MNDYKSVLQEQLDVAGRCKVEEVVCDFEVALWKAIQSVFPQTSIRGCYFHWTQAVFKHITENGLKDAYSSVETSRTFLRKVLSLPLLPSELIRRAFKLLNQEAKTFNDNRLVTFMEYVRRQWIDRKGYVEKQKLLFEVWNAFIEGNISAGTMHGRCSRLVGCPSNL